AATAVCDVHAAKDSASHPSVCATSSRTCQLRAPAQFEEDAARSGAFKDENRLLRYMRKWRWKMTKKWQPQKKIVRPIREPGARAQRLEGQGNGRIAGFFRAFPGCA